MLRVRYSMQYATILTRRSTPDLRDSMIPYMVSPSELTVPRLVNLKVESHKIPSSDSSQFTPLTHSLWILSQWDILSHRLQKILDKGFLRLNGKKSANASRDRASTTQELLGQPAHSAGDNTIKCKHCKFILLV